MRRVSIALVLLLAIGAAYWLWRDGRQTLREQREPASASSGADPRASTSRSPGSADSGKDPTATGRAGAAAPGSTAAFDEADFPIAAPLNAPDSTIARDLDIVSQLFDAWRSNFPREGNPVGENSEITAALMGDNPLKFAFIPKA